MKSRLTNEFRKVVSASYIDDSSLRRTWRNHGLQDFCGDDAPETDDATLFAARAFCYFCVSNDSFNGFVSAIAEIHAFLLDLGWRAKDNLESELRILVGQKRIDIAGAEVFYNTCYYRDPDRECARF